MSPGIMANCVLSILTSLFVASVRCYMDWLQTKRADYEKFISML